MSTAAQGAGRGVADLLAGIRAEGRAALIGYLPVGYPSVEASLTAMEVLVSRGVDILEIGVPYTDPVLDGPVIQAAGDHALSGGTRVDDVFRATAAVRAAGAPPLVMTAWNLVLARGVDIFADDLARHGGAGLITPDLIPDEAAREGMDWLAASDRHGLDRVFLVAPSSTPERLVKVTSACRGFVYAASTMGVTGTRSAVGAGAHGLVERVRGVTDVPVCVGLGVSNADQAAEIAGYADGVIVGSAFVKTLAAAARDPRELDASLTALGALADELVAGVRRGAR